MRSIYTNSYGKTIHSCVHTLLPCVLYTLIKQGSQGTHNHQLPTTVLSNVSYHKSGYNQINILGENKTIHVPRMCLTI